MPEQEPQYFKEFTKTLAKDLTEMKTEMRESFTEVNRKLDKHSFEINEIQNTLKHHTRQLDSHSTIRALSFRWTLCRMAGGADAARKYSAGPDAGAGPRLSALHRQPVALAGNPFLVASVSLRSR